MDAPKPGCVYPGTLTSAEVEGQAFPKEHKEPTVSTARLQLALNVADLDTAVDFYTRMFGVPPAKTRPGYANFAVADPPLKLVLFEDPGAAAAGALNHLGVELATTADVTTTAAAFDRAGLTTRTVESEVCCNAAQDKVYVAAPDVPLGMWEYYTIVDDNPDETAGDASGTCCASPAAETADRIGEQACCG